jgi:polar amino acid transport system substrate-binding protein
VSKLPQHLAVGLLLGLILFAVAKPLHARDSVSVTTGEWPPFISEALPGKGPVLQAVTEAFAIRGVKADVAFNPWNRSLVLAKEGRADTTAVWGPAESREADFLFSDAVLESPLSFFHLKGSDFDWEDYADLRGLRVGVTLGNKYTAAFHEAEEAGVFQTFKSSSEKLGLRALFAGRLDVYVVNRDAGYRIARANHSERFDQLTHHAKPLRVSTYHLLVSRKLKDAQMLVDTFNEGLRELKANGRIDALYKRISPGS